MSSHVGDVVPPQVPVVLPQVPGACLKSSRGRADHVLILSVQWLVPSLWGAGGSILVGSRTFHREVPLAQVRELRPDLDFSIRV